MEDWKLLEKYVNKGSEKAFAEIAAKYTNIVYSACLRQVYNPASSV